MNEQQKKALADLLGQHTNVDPCLAELIKPEPKPNTWEDKGGSHYQAEAILLGEPRMGILHLWVGSGDRAEPNTPVTLFKYQARELRDMLTRYLNGKRLDGKEGE